MFGLYSFVIKKNLTIKMMDREHTDANCDI